MKAYVAGRISRQGAIKDIIQKLADHSISITRNWTWNDGNNIQSEEAAAAFRKNAYAKPSEKYRLEAENDIKAVLEADLFIILTDPHGSSMYVELGAAIAAHTLTGKPKYIFAIGPHFDRMVMYQHNIIQRVDSIDEIISALQSKRAI